MRGWPVRRVGAAVFAAALAAGALAQNIALGVTMPPGGIAFGDAFEVTVERSWLIAYVPDEFDERSLAPLVVELAAKEVDPGSGFIGTPVCERRRYRARCFAAGDVKLGPLTMRCRAGEHEVTAASGQIVLSVRSSLPEPAGGFEWPGDVRELPSPARWTWVVAALVLLLGGVFWWRRPRAVAPVGASIVAPPEPTALRDLRALRVPGDDADAGAVVAFFTDVKRLVRQHCRERFTVAAEVCTSEELQRLVPSEQLAACLRACDLVLFAAVLPAAAQRACALAAALDFAAEVAP